MTGETSPGFGSEPLTKAERVRRMADQSLEELARQLEAGNSAQLNAYLKAMGRFHRYSFGNLLLILLQKPDATHVAGFHAWKSLGRVVNRGEKGIAIFAPMMVKPRARDDLRTEDADGEREAPPQLRFRVVYVFDVSQTEGKPLPEFAHVGGDPGEALARLEKAVRDSGVTLETVDDLGGAFGTSSGGTIKLLAGMEPSMRFSVLAHEWAHEILHQSVPVDQRPPKTVRETEAEAVAFVVCHALGLNTYTASADYIRLYSGDTSTLLASFDRIQKLACVIIEKVVSSTRHSQGPVEPQSAPPSQCATLTISGRSNKR